MGIFVDSKMNLDVFSRLVWLVAAATFAASIGIYDGFRFTSLFLCLLSCWVLVSKIKVSDYTRDDYFLFFAFIAYGLSMFFFQYIDTYTWPIPSLPSRFFIILPVILLLFKVNDYKYFLWYGISIGSILAFSFAFYQYKFLGYERSDGGLPAIMFGDMGMMLGLLSFVSCAYFYIQKNYMWLLISLIAILCGTGASFLSDSRGGWIALPIIIPFLLWQCRGLFKKRLVVTLLILLTSSISVFWFSPNASIKVRFDTAVNQVVEYYNGQAKNTSVGLRFEMWKLAGYMFLEHPILGAGRESSFELKESIAEAGKVTRPAIDFTHSHNEVFDSIGYRGVTGLIFLMVIYLVPLLLFYKKIKKYRDSWDIKVYALAGILIPFSFIVFGLTAVLFVHKVAVTMYVFSIAYFWVALRLAEKEDQSSK